MNLTTEQITALAPDAASIKAGRGLVNPAKWPTLGRSAEALWGECRGSGSAPYQVSVALGGLTFKCTCPSRKFPCKHALGLLWLAVERPAATPISDPPPWVADWLAARQAKAEKSAAASNKASPSADPAASAKRAAKRLKEMEQGGVELTRWLSDQVRNGLATYPQQSATYFTKVAARLVDAKMPGLVNEIARLESLIHSGDGWPQRTLGQLGRMSLIMEGLRRFSSLPAPLQGDLRVVLGWAMEKEEVLANAQRVTDEWCVSGQVFTERERLWERRTWLIGRNAGRQALLLDFMHGQRSFAAPLAVGSGFRAELAFYPSAYPLRALLANPPESTQPVREPLAALPDFNAALAARAEALAANPWLLTYPFAVEKVIPLRRPGGWRLRDAQGAELPLTVTESDAWELLALSGGHPVAVFGEWSDNQLRALGVWANGFHGLGGAER